MVGRGTVLALQAGMKIHCRASNHIGRRRNDEDAHAVRPDLGLIVVADGMGGYEGGEIASHLVVESVVQLFERTHADSEATWPHAPHTGQDGLQERVRVGLIHAHTRVLEHREGFLSRMGSTAVVVAWNRGHLVVGHVGDSRVYRLRAGSLERLTRDHSFAEEARAAGFNEDAALERYRSMLTRAIGMPGSCVADIARDDLLEGDVLLLCSDGVWEPLTDTAIREALTHNPDDAAQRLVAQAYAAGGSDNMTAVVLRVDEPVLPQEPA